MLCFLYIGYSLRHYEISLPWSLSVLPYASFLVMLGKELADYKKRIETPLSFYWVTGTLMVFRLSVWIRNASTMFSNIFTKVGRETYVVVAFSQVTVMCINYLFTLNPLLKYAILVIVLILLKYLKDGINRLVRIKIL